MSTDDVEVYCGEDEDSMYTDGSGDGQFFPSPSQLSDSGQPPAMKVTTLTVADCFAMIISMISQPIETYCMSTGVVLALLQDQKWSPIMLMERFTDDDARMLSKLGLTAEQSRSDQNLLESNSGPVACVVCWDEGLAPGKAVSVGCKHWCCAVCAQSYLDGILRTKSPIGARCPKAGCKLLLPIDSWKRLASPSSFALFERKVVGAFIAESSLGFRWCANPRGCGGIVRAEHVPETARPGFGVKCFSCSYSFCFACGAEDHNPASCDDLRQWERKCKDDSETANWLIVNTKSCPQCRKATEKNGGCNHMTCSQCRHEWCWVCMGSWSQHGSSFYQCNFYSEKAKNVAANDEKQKESARASLERYMHYFTRYQNHDESKKLDAMVLARVQERMRQCISSGMTPTDASYLEQTAHTLFMCRRTLKYSYVYAYYLTSGNRKLFDHNQGQLEFATEQLSKMIEGSDVERLAVLDRTAVAAKMLKNLQEGVFVER
jgi:ariadne-1